MSRTMHLTTSARRKAPRVLSLTAVAAVAVTALVAAPARAAVTAAPAAPVSTAVPAAAPAVAAAPPAGPLTATSPSCSGTGTVTCDLYAETGYTSVVGSSQLLTWRFSPVHQPAAVAPVTTTTPATAGSPAFDNTANPTIIVNQGDTLNLVLHNELTNPASSALLPGGAAGAALSLSVPGLKGNNDDRAGLDPSATDTRTYSVRATKAGTFLYQAGHTAVGPRAVAMGLVGAIVVRPTGYVAGSAQTDLGTASSAFDDEQVMVLTDVDPKLSADPLGFDLRNFHSTYRMINGASYPKTPDIPTAAGRKVLLRYVNGGVLSHAMGPAGQRQNVVAIDAQPDASGALVADTIPPGATEDAVVVAPEGKTPVYDVSGSLDNAGIGLSGDASTASGANLKRVNLGGLMQLLTTTPAVPTGDTVGPRSTITAVSGTTLSLTFTDLASPWCAAAAGCGPGDVIAAEYWADDDPGAGAGTVIPVTAGNPVSASATVDTTTLTNGQHRVYVRAKDASGNWGAPVSVVITVLKNGPSTTALTVTPKAARSGGTLTLGATGDGSTNGGGVAAMDYWLVGPGGVAPTPGLTPDTGAAFTITPGSVVAASAVATLPTTAAEGTWTYYVASKGANGTWGALASVTFVVDNTGASASGVTGAAVTPNPTDGLTGDPVDPTALKVQATFADNGGVVPTGIVAAEGFLGTASATTAPAAVDGNGFVFVANDGAFDGSMGATKAETAYGLIPLSQLTQFATDGTYYVWIHGKDAAGNWGPLVAVPFTINRAPVVSGVTIAQQTATAYTLTITGTSSAAVSGASYSANGGTTWSPCSPVGTAGPGAVSVTCAVTLSAAPTGDLTIAARLTSTRGTSAPRSVTLAAALPGLAGSVTVLSGGGTQATTAANPAAATYLGSFTFTPGTLTTGAGYVTIAALRNGGAGNVVAVQYRRQSNGSNGIIRLQVNGATAASTATVAPGAAVTVTIRRFAGSAVQVSVGGTTITGAVAPAGSTVTTAVLGRVGTAGTVTWAGSATIAGFTATRF